MHDSDILDLVSLWGAAVVASFAVAFFVICGLFVLLHIANVRPLPEDSRKHLFAVFLVSTLASVAGVVGVVFSKDRIQAKQDLQVAEQQRNSAVAALGEATSPPRNEDCSCEDSRNAENSGTTDGTTTLWGTDTPIVFIHVFQSKRVNLAKEMSASLSEKGVLVPGIESVSIAVEYDQLRYFHSSAEEQAQILGNLLQLSSEKIRFIDGFQERVGPEHFEIWLSP